VQSSTSNGAHAVTGGGVPPGGIDDEFDMLSSRSKSPPNAAAASAGTGSIHFSCGKNDWNCSLMGFA